MPVYVDKLYNHGFRIRGRTVLSCHLFADGLEELEEFGAKLGLKKSWIHYSNLIHFDITENKREEALRLGAVFLRGRHLLRKFKQLTKD